MEPTPVIRSFEALMGAEPDVADAFLFAAVYARALREDRTPRDIIDALFKAMPSADAWPALRTSLRAILEDLAE